MHYSRFAVQSRGPWSSSNILTIFFTVSSTVSDGKSESVVDGEDVGGMKGLEVVGFVVGGGVGSF